MKMWQENRKIKSKFGNQNFENVEMVIFLWYFNSFTFNQNINDDQFIRT
jgi:hypothetical protein